MDELAALIEKLEGEVAALETEVDQRHGDEERQLAAQQLRLSTADARLTRARSQLASDGGALSALESRRTELLARIESWRGELWRIGHGTAVSGLLLLAIIPIPPLMLWRGGTWMGGALALEAALFAAAFFLIPEKR